ncbi:vWA domain-containing protein [Microcoleus sp. herbarium2]|uniref:vWA domain-containing protein n=1 Tax=Microcoleus sp. herbarium2 TaxID=3055433 RepID=UPI002FD49151
MQNLFGQLRQKLSKPILFSLYGAVGCLSAATLLGEAFLALTKLPPTIQRSPQAIVLLIDCSGSMNENNKLQEAKLAAQSFVRRQNLSQNRIAVVGFGSKVHSATSLTSDITTLEQAISGLADGGSTRMDSGISAAAEELKSNSFKRNILLFTDGVPDAKFLTSPIAQWVRFQGINIVAVATDGADTGYLAEITGNPSLVFYASSGQFEQAFQEAEKVIYSSQLVESGATGNYGLVYSMFRIGGWTALLAIGTSLALIAGQNHYLRRRLLTPSEGSIGTGGSLVAGVAAGAIGQLLFLPVAGIPILALGGRVIGWTILGTFLGGGMSFFVPNLEIRRALQAGGIGGAAGAIGFLLVSATSGDLVGRLVGAAIVGFFIGLAIALIEDLSRRAWLIVHWTPTEQTPINLGTTPVIFGSSEDAHIYLRKDLGYPPVVAKIYLESGKIIMQFDEEMQKLKGMKILRHELANGDRRKIGEVMIEVKTAMEKLP